MKGNIYTDERCPVCGSTMPHDENRQGCFCLEHKSKASGHFRVRFGRAVHRRFNTYKEAQQFLWGCRWKTVENSFDARDYRKDNPLAFNVVAEKYLDRKRSEISPNYFRDVSLTVTRAILAWGSRSIKTIGTGEIEDFLDGMGVGQKTKFNHLTALRGLFRWVARREKGFDPPEFPAVRFELAMRTIVPINIQSQIIDEVQRIAPERVWIGIRWLATYIAIRPNEMRFLRERDINVSGCLVVRRTKDRRPKIIAMRPDDIALYEQIQPKGMPDLYFFRHTEAKGKAKHGDQYSKELFYRWFMRACDNLGIVGVDLYGATRHSTVTALGQHFSEEQIRKAGTIHSSNSAFARYFQYQADSLPIYEKAAEMRGEVVDLQKKRAANGVQTSRKPAPDAD